MQLKSSKMSLKKRSRSEKDLPLDVLLSFPAIERTRRLETRKYDNSFDHFLGENINDTISSCGKSDIENGEFKKINEEGDHTPTKSMMSGTGSDLDGIVDFNTKLSDLSSSSSLSWSEEYELEITKKVQLELEKLDRIFRDLEEVPLPYDRGEIAEWKQLFPQLCILGHKTPTNSTNNSDMSSDSDDGISQSLKQKNHLKQTIKETYNSPTKETLFVNEKRAQKLPHQSRNFHTLPRKPRSLEIERYLKISPFKSPEVNKHKPSATISINKHRSLEKANDASPEYTSLPYITATPLKVQNQRARIKCRNPKQVTLPPITNHFRSISATPRQSSSKSMFVSLNFEKDASAKGAQISLKNDLLKLFEHIPVSNR